MRHVMFSVLLTVALLAACAPAASPTQSPGRLPAEQSPFDTSPLPTVEAPATQVMPSPLLPTAIGTEEPGGRAAVFPNTIIVYQRAGKQWTFYHTGRIVAGDGTEWQVPATEVEALFSLVEAPDFWQLSASYAAAEGCPDCPVQTLIVYRQAEIKEITVAQELPGLPENLQQVLVELEHLVAKQA